MGAAAAVASWRYLFRSPIEPMVDLQVYQRAADAVRTGGVLYEQADTRLVFTYPPFAAVVAVVVTPLRGWWGQLAWTVATTAALVAVVQLSFRPLLARWSPSVRVLALAALTAIALVSHPMLEHVFFGQVNVFLVLLCLVDLLVLAHRRVHGALIGVAAALKLTPAVFVPHLWLTGRRRAAVVAGLTAAGCTALAWIVLPDASVEFWTDRVAEGDRIARSIGYTSNQSLRGLVARLVPDGYGTALWAVVAVAVAWYGLRRARDAHRAGDERGGIALVALLPVLLSPIAWIHHLVWFLPMIGALAADGRDRRRLVAAAAAALVLLLRLPWWGWSLLDDGPVVAPLGVLMHNAYVVLGLALLVAYPVRGRVPDDEPVSVASAHGRTRRNGADRPVPAGRR